MVSVKSSVPKSRATSPKAYSVRTKILSHDESFHRDAMHRWFNSRICFKADRFKVISLSSTLLSARHSQASKKWVSEFDGFTKKTLHTFVTWTFSWCEPILFHTIPNSLLA